ncbi:MAG: cobamide remodeling phosphodiesterase CbiR [Chloroflexota bacterium]
MDRYPFRLGTTSYIIPAGLVDNARYLTGKVQDMELVLFDLDDGTSNLPTVAEATELRQIGQEHDLSYTVHLPLDIRWGKENGASHPSLVKARKVIDCTAAIEPLAYVLHLDGRSERTLPPNHPNRLAWQANAVKALQLLAGWVGNPTKLAVENVEGYPLDFAQAVLAQITVSRCVDIGHLWVDGHQPQPYLAAALPHTQVIHLHGLAERDHQSLEHANSAELRQLLRMLERYTGVLTLEIFGEPDFESSVMMLESCWEKRWEND